MELKLLSFVLIVNTKWQTRGDTHDQFTVRLQLVKRHTQDIVCVSLLIV